MHSPGTYIKSAEASSGCRMDRTKASTRAARAPASRTPNSRNVVLRSHGVNYCSGYLG